ncbi:hypothetical protein EH30_12905 [Erythrobacter sp. JL475]|nr:hypothetical protein EH30_12905 [Erythrobacter sp. JL475]
MKGWEATKLGKIIKLEYGKPLPKEDRQDDGRYFAFGANGPLARTNRYYWQKPSIIVGRKGSAGELKLVEEPFWPLDVTYFVTFDEAKFSLKYLYYQLVILNLPSLAKGVKPGINRNDVYDIDVTVPPLAEQQRIVDILNQAFEGIAKARANTEAKLRQLETLEGSILHQAFSGNL